jgi:hypothetical protein
MPRFPKCESREEYIENGQCSNPEIQTWKGKIKEIKVGREAETSTQVGVPISQNSPRLELI